MLEGGGLRGPKIVNKNVENKLAFPKESQEIEKIKATIAFKDAEG